MRGGSYNTGGLAGEQGRLPIAIWLKVLAALARIPLRSTETLKRRTATAYLGVSFWFVGGSLIQGPL